MSTFKIKCIRLQGIPQCSGIAEGCSGQTWLAGFNLYIIENSTRVTLLVLLHEMKYMKNEDLIHKYKVIECN